VDVEMALGGARDFLFRARATTPVRDPEPYRELEGALRRAARASKSGGLSTPMQERLAAIAPAQTVEGLLAAVIRTGVASTLPTAVDKLSKRFAKMDAVNPVQPGQALEELKACGVDLPQAALRQILTADSTGLGVDIMDVLLAAVPVAEAERAIEAEFPPEQLAVLKDVFARHVRGGLVQSKAVAEAAKALNRRPQGRFHELDWGGFLAAIQASPTDPDDELLQAFNRFDLKRQGWVYLADVAATISSLMSGEISEQELRVLALEAKFEDENLDRLTFKEFVKMIMSC
jgi:Ca2+-binding EF-hand superfamily protein